MKLEGKKSCDVLVST